MIFFLSLYGIAKVLIVQIITKRSEKVNFVLYTDKSVVFILYKSWKFERDYTFLYETIL